MKTRLPLIGFITLSLLSLPVIAQEISFKTIEQAQGYCPDIHQMKELPQSDKPLIRIIAVDKPGFVSSYDYPGVAASHDSNGYIANMQFRNENGSYGNIKGSLISCYYYYPEWDGMRSLTMIKR